MRVRRGVVMPCWACRMRVAGHARERCRSWGSVVGLCRCCVSMGSRFVIFLSPIVTFLTWSHLSLNTFRPLPISRRTSHRMADVSPELAIEGSGHTGVPFRIVWILQSTEVVDENSELATGAGVKASTPRSAVS